MCAKYQYLIHHFSLFITFVDRGQLVVIAKMLNYFCRLAAKPGIITSFLDDCIRSSEEVNLLKSILMKAKITHEITGNPRRTVCHYFFSSEPLRHSCQPWNVASIFHRK